jgi:hypothetical protein
MSGVDVAHVIWALLRDNGAAAELDLVAGLSDLATSVPRPDLAAPIWPAARRSPWTTTNTAAVV